MKAITGYNKDTVYQYEVNGKSNKHVLSKKQIDRTEREAANLAEQYSKMVPNTDINYRPLIDKKAGHHVHLKKDVTPTEINAYLETGDISLIEEKTFTTHNFFRGDTSIVFPILIVISIAIGLLVVRKHLR